MAYQAQGGPAFSAYVFKSGGQLLYCHRRVDGSRDYRSGSWSVVAGYLWIRPHNDAGRADGELRLNLPGAVTASVVLDGASFSVSPSGGGLVAAIGRFHYPSESGDTCGSLELDPPA